MSTDTHDSADSTEPTAASEPTTAAEPTEIDVRPTTVAAAGLIGGIGMGLIMDLVMNAMPAVAALYGASSPAVGWAAHLVHSVVFAFAFVALLARTDLGRYARTATGAIGVGAAYGLALTVTAGWFVMPIWLNAIAGMSMPVPLITVEGLAAHLVYGLLLGGVYAAGRETTEPADSGRAETSEETEASPSEPAS